MSETHGPSSEAQATNEKTAGAATPTASSELAIEEEYRPKASRTTATSPDNPMLAAALEYQAQGYHVIPLEPGTKKALVKWKAYQEIAPSDDQVRAWWRDTPDAGIGFVLGAASGLAVVDVDPRNGAACDAELERTPSGAVVETGGGGIHIYLRHPGAGRIKTGPSSIRGVDIKADGGYVVAPPSIHPDTGKPYRWRTRGAPGEVPAWMSNGATRTPVDVAAPSEREPWISDAIEHPERIPEGEQEEKLKSLVWYFRNRVDPDIARATL